ncbi:MAG: hypothetical protein N3E49_00575 [Bacteroidia bacterium]|nr:hypothetical protein [Bacteroidia bacterium]
MAHKNSPPPLLWIALSALLTLLYLPITLNNRDIFIGSAETLEDCKKSDYCRPNLHLFPIRFIAEQGDSWSYLRPIEYAFTQGIYWDDYRMPGYGAVYAIFLFITGSKDLSIWCLIIVQIILWSAAVGLIAREMVIRGISRRSAWLFVMLVSLSPASYYVRSLSTESLTASAGLVGVLSLMRGWYGLSGFLLSWAFFMRPVHVLWIVIGFIYVASRLDIKKLFFFCLPILLIEGAWVGRNYIRYGDFRPLTGSKTTFYPHVYSRYDFQAIELYRRTEQSDMREAIRGRNLISLLFCYDSTPPALEDIPKITPNYLLTTTCPPESLHTATQLACDLNHSPSYTYMPPESLFYGKRYVSPEAYVINFAPDSNDCEKEKRLVNILRTCSESLKRYRSQNPLFVVKAFLHHIFGTSYAYSHYDKVSSSMRATLKRLYYSAYSWIYLVAFIASLYYLVMGEGLSRLSALYAGSILMAYAAIGLVERRYIESVSPLLMIQFIYLLQGGEQSLRRLINRYNPCKLRGMQ